MKNVYYAFVLFALMCLGTATPGYATDATPIGLRAETVRMSGLEKLASVYMTPTYAMLASLSTNPATSFVNNVVEEGEQTLGGGLVYGSEIEKLGLQLTYFYFMTAAIALGGDLTFFFPEKTSVFGSSFTQTLITLNVMAHYIVFTTLIMRAYVLGGLNYALFRFKNKGAGFDVSDSSSELGVNLGGGIEYALAAGFLYLELKYVISNFDQFVLAVGYRHILGR